MQRSTKIILALALVAAGAFAFNSNALVHSQTNPSMPVGEHLQVISTLLPSGVQQVLIVDSDSKSMAVYQVEPVHGKLQLKSVRQFVWDLQMEQFNGQVPLPSELREMQPATSSQ